MKAASLPGSAPSYWTRGPRSKPQRAPSSSPHPAWLYWTTGGKRLCGLSRGARHGAQYGAQLSIPNLITLGRILLVPVVVWAITAGEMRAAFALFLAAGVTDAVDGFLAKRFKMQTELGAYLDPL